VTFCTATPFQHALARAFVADDSFFRDLHNDYRARRDRLCDGLRDIGLGVLVPAGTYFVMTDIRTLGYHDDVAFCRMLPEKIGVAAIPPSSFYVNPHEGRHLVRWAFCKTDEVLDEALRRLQKLRPAT
jgi:N-succinyldiaminopimelate aminotransferase